MRSSRTRTVRALAWAGVVAFTVAAASLPAQARQRGAPADPSAPSRPRVAPVLWEPEQIFPLAMQHANDLHLTDAQRVKIEALGSDLRARNRLLLQAIDTLRPQRPDPGDGSTPAATPPPPTAEEIAAIVAKRHALGEARAQLHDNTRIARDSLMAALTPDQQSRLQQVEQSARSAAERGDPGESGEGRGGQGAGGRGRPPY